MRKIYNFSFNGWIILALESGCYPISFHKFSKYLTYIFSITLIMIFKIGKKGNFYCDRSVIHRSCILHHIFSNVGLFRGGKLYIQLQVIKCWAIKWWEINSSKPKREGVFCKKFSSPLKRAFFSKHSPTVQIRTSAQLPHAGLRYRR